MSEYQLSQAADDDLLQIALYGFENFGAAQSERYRDKLEKQFSIIADNPLSYASVDHIRAGYRRSVCGSHSIYYVVENQNILIVRILRRQDTRTAF